MASHNEETHDPTSHSERQGLPPWDQLPDIELYMDQVLSLMTRYLGATVDENGKGLTASMVNNYVKTGLVPAPIKKRYNREHLAHLAIVCTLKSVLPLASIRTLLDRELAEETMPAFYERFRVAFVQTERAARCALEEDGGSALHAALRARAERDLAVSLY